MLGSLLTSISRHKRRYTAQISHVCIFTTKCIYCLSRKHGNFCRTSIHKAVLTTIHITLFYYSPMDSLLTFIKSYEQGVTEDQICIMNPGLSQGDLVKHLNECIKSNKITVFKNNNKIYYKAITDACDDYESMIINLISQSGTEGMWIRDIREKTNMPHNLVIKILNTMENKRVIKSVKNIKNNKKVYVLYDIIPSEEITGGFWFNDNDVDIECVENVSKVICNYIRKKTTVEGDHAVNKYSNNISLLQITEFVNDLNFLNSKVNEADMKILVDALVFDQKLERLVDNGIERYRIL